ncbi:MAG: hypothetical protein IT371_25840 [Deltaproteobacteria bacterium]|nr:hypothetical protein [Deltaproteobacteria bacterium]
MSRSRPRALVVLAALSALVGGLGPLGLARRVEAQALWGRSTTYLRGFVRPGADETLTYLPFTEAIELHADRLGPEGLSLHTSFWGAVDLLELQNRYRLTGDLASIYLAYRAPETGRFKALRGLELAVGRQFVALGPTVLEQLDGGKLQYTHRSGFQLGLFGGVPSGVRVLSQSWPIDEDRYGYGYNWLAGARVGYLSLGKLALGSSFVHRRYRGRLADQDWGFDASYQPTSWLDLSGTTTLSLVALRLKHARASATFYLPKEVTLDVGFQMHTPDLFVPRSSIFAVFAETTFHELRADALWQVSRRVSVEAGYGRRFYGDGMAEAQGERPGANRVSVRGTVRYGADARGRAVLEAERIEAPDNAVNRVRLATTYPFPFWRERLRLTLDVDFYVLDELAREVRTSLTGAAYLEAALSEQLRLLAGGSVGTTTLMREASTLLVRLSWDFGVPSPSGAVRVQRGGYLR